MNRKFQLLKYLISDYLTAFLSWGSFFVFRKIYFESRTLTQVFSEFDIKFILGLVFIPIFWIFIYYASGYYKDRLAEMGQTLANTFIGVIILFFVLILDDTIHSYSNYYLSFAVLFTFHFVLTYIPRLIITTSITHKIHRRIVGFNTLIIGSNEKAVAIFKEIESQPKSSGNKFVGFINVNDNNRHQLARYLPHLGSLDDVKKIIIRNQIKEVIIAIESSEHDKIGKIINKLIDCYVVIKAIPSMYDILTGRVPLIQISHQLMPAWQENIKNITDIVLSLLALVILSPLCIFLTIGVKLSSKGPILYSHERIGRYGKPFTIYKFRSMYVNAELNGPELSSKNDTRITKFGRFMRKSRLDEIPNFFNVIKGEFPQLINVLKGEMSLVGPRPERKYYIEKITKRAPHYLHLLKVKPGITSWGQVKFGYAEDVDQMIKRLKYDMIYLDNMSLYVDIKIIIYTLLTIVRRKGV